MMEREWRKILARYGQAVTLERDGTRVSLRAFVQPESDRGRDQEVPSPRGFGRQDRFLYLGPPEYPLDRKTLVHCNGQDYRVQAAHRRGEGVCPHWQATLYPREEEAV